MREVPIRFSGAEKRRLTVTLTCIGNSDMLPVFKGKRKLKFKPPKDVRVTVQQKGWMDSSLMFAWFKSVILPFTKDRRSLLVIDSFSAHEDIEFLNLAAAHNIDEAIIPGRCTNKIQPLDVSLMQQAL